jgi:hypothetical protein
VRSKIASALLAMLLVTSVLSGAAAPALAQSSGYVGVPDSNVTEDLPAGASVELSASDLHGSVIASDHADSLQVVVTTPDRAADYVNGSRVGSGDLALVFKDDSVHEGRTVAVPADAIRRAVGHVPEVVHGVHEDGSEWTSQVRAENELLYFEIPKFSSNSVTFSGTVEITATPATDGSSFSYDLSGTDSVSDPVVNLTGRLSSENETDSGTVDITADGKNATVSIAGNAEPSGQTSTEPQLTVTPSSATEGIFSSTSTSGSVTKNDTELGISRVKSVYVSLNDVGTEYKSESFDYSMTAYVDGTDIGGISGTVSDDGSDSATLSVPSDLQDYNEIEVTWNIDESSGTGDVSASWSASATSVAGENLTVTVDGQTTDIGTLSDGESKTVAVDPSVTTENLTISGTGGTADWGLEYVEKSKTTDPAIEINGETASHSGTLADGETTSLSLSSSALQEGTNRLNVSVGDGGLSPDAPPMQVDLEYRHEASTSVSTEYFGDGFAETYEVSHTFSATQTDPTLRVPFSATVYRLPQLEWSINDGSWSSVPDGRYSWENDTLVVELKDDDTDGDVDAGTKIEVRTEGRMVEVNNGQISVPEPTDPDAAQIDSKIQIESRSSDFNIVVGKDERLHYAYDESWDTVQDSSVVASDGTQQIYLPNADAGDTAWITTAPIEIVPQSGDARVRVQDPDGPEIKVSGGPSGVGDDVAIRYYAVTDGKTYEAYSVSRERPVSKDTAEDGVAVFAVDDSEEVLRFQLAGSSDGGGDTSSQFSGGNWPQPSPGTTLQEIAVVVAWAALVVGLVAATGRSELAGRPRWILVGSISLGTGLLSIEVLRPGTISAAIGSGLQDVVPLAGLAAIGIVGYSVVSWWQSRRKEAATPETTVDFNLGRFRR